LILECVEVLDLQRNGETPPVIFLPGVFERDF